MGNRLVYDPQKEKEGKKKEQELLCRKRRRKSTAFFTNRKESSNLKWVSTTFAGLLPDRGGGKDLKSS